MKVCLVCSPAGHLTEMLELKDAFHSHEFFLMTYEEKFLNLPKNIRKIYFIKNLLIGSVDTNLINKLLLFFAQMLMATIKEFIVLLKERPTIIISTGSEIAIPIFYMGKVLGKKVVFVESVCRVCDFSGTGKIVYPIADEFFVQWEKLAKKYKKARYEGSIILNISKSKLDENKKENFIFVTVGTAAFPRLVKKMDEIAGKIDEKVIIQIGRTKYKPKNAEYFDFTNYEEIQELNQKARVVVCHDGVGSIISALHYCKPVIAVLRLRKYKEVYYDNKGEFANELAKKGTIKVAHNIENLESELRNINTNIQNTNLTKFKNDKKLLHVLKEYLLDQSELDRRYS